MHAQTYDFVPEPSSDPVTGYFTISGGVMNDLTFGVNWFCNPFCKVVFNYIHSWRQSPSNPPNTVIPAPTTALASEVNAFGIRTQMDF